MVRVYNFGSWWKKKSRVWTALLLVALLGLGACGGESAPSSATVSGTPTQSGKPTPKAVTPVARVTTAPVTFASGGGSGSAAIGVAATATTSVSSGIGAIATTTSSAVPTGTIAIVQDGRLVLVKADGSGNKEVADLGADVSDKLNVVWSPDGSRFLLNEGSRKLSLVEMDGKRTALLEVDPATERIGIISWATSGKYMAFERMPIGEQGRETKGEIWVADLTDPAKPGLAVVAKGFSPSFSPDGRNIAFLTQGRDVKPDGPVQNNAISLVSADGKQSRQVLDVEQLPDYRNPTDGQMFELRPTLFSAVSWSPDGRTLSFQDSRNFVATVATTGGKVKVWWYNTAREEGRISKMLWSPKSDRLLIGFTPDSDKGKQRLILVDGQGKSGQVPGENNSCVEWSPDGSAVATGNGKEIAAVRANDQQASGTVKTSGCPVWSPDVAWLALSVENGTEVAKGLQVARIDGSGLQILANPNATRQLKIVGWRK